MQLSRYSRSFPLYDKTYRTRPNPENDTVEAENDTLFEPSGSLAVSRHFPISHLESAGFPLHLLQEMGPGAKPLLDLGLVPLFPASLLPRKEVIQPHLPIRLPCYDFTPVIGLTFDGWLLSVTSPASGATNSHGVTGGVYKARERIHRGMLIRDY